MSEILHDLSEPALVRAIEANLFELFELWPRAAANAEVHSDADKLWTVTDVPFPLFNSVLHAQFAPNDVDAAIDRVVSRYRSRDVPMLWWTGPATRPSDLGTHLEAHGLARDEDGRGMAVDLRSLTEESPEQTGLVIDQVGDSGTLRQWCDAATLGYGMPGFCADGLFDCFGGLGFAEPLPLRNYIGWLDGEPVATSSLFLAEGVAGIYDVATVPDRRCRGFGSAMTCRAMRDARAMGYHVGVLVASNLGAGVYGRLGFQDHCDIGQYVWSPAPAGEATA
jgi:ribosomal protein S18 acetylase RimI-like enzyme